MIMFQIIHSEQGRKKTNKQWRNVTLELTSDNLGSSGQASLAAHLHHQTVPSAQQQLDEVTWWLERLAK